MAGGTNYEPKNRGTFQPRVEAEEGDPKRGDFVIAVVVAVCVIAGILWAFGVVNL
jgi:hypothetical protein